MLEDLRMFGLAQAEIDRARADLLAQRRAPDALDIHPDNIAAVKLFQALQTQWNRVPLSTMSSARLITLGLKYESVETTARLSGLGEVTPDTFTRVRFMEVEALEAWAEAARD